MSQDLQAFQDLIRDSKLPIFVYFGAKWCVPCRSFSPIFEDLGKKYQSQAMFIRVDADSGHDIMIEYNVSKIPTLKTFLNGILVDELSGMNEASFKKLLAKYQIKLQ